MAVHAGLLRFSTQGHGEVVDLTEGVRRVVAQAGVQVGVATVFGQGSTVAVTTIEYEPGAVRDLEEALERLLPVAGDYEHNRRNADTNAHAHLRAALIGPSESIPGRGRRARARDVAAGGPRRLRRPPTHAYGACARGRLSAARRAP